MFDEIQTRITIAADILLTASVMCRNEGSNLTEEQAEHLNRVYDAVEELRKEVAPN
jgi:hypothetical protein